MGWCSGTGVFDKMAKFIINSPQPEDQKVEALVHLAQALEDQDWDCQQDSDFYEDPIVRRALRQLHPDWESLKDDDTNPMDRFLGYLPEPVKGAVRTLAQYGQEDGAHHKAWAIDQTARALLGVHYGAFVRAYESGEDGHHTYTWHEGIAP